MKYIKILNRMDPPPLKTKRVRKPKKPVVDVPVFKITRGNFLISFGKEAAVVSDPIETPHTQTHT
jgi:hypothetical protein